MKRITELDYLELIQIIKNKECKNYSERYQRHRNPDSFAKQVLRELSERLVSFQNTNQLNQILLEVNRIFETDKDLKSYFIAIREFCILNDKDLNFTAKLIAEYNGMDMAYRTISAENLFDKKMEQTEQSDGGDELSNNNKESTTARQVLVIHLLLEYCKVKRTEVDNSEIARFIQFLTGKNYKNIYDLVKGALWH